jgi:hypothetical protein
MTSLLAGGGLPQRLKPVSFFGHLAARLKGGWPGLLISLVSATQRGAQSFVFFAKGASRERLRGLAQLCTATTEAAPPFVTFEGWVPGTLVSGDFARVNFDSRVESMRLDQRIRTKIEARGAHPSKTAKGGAASVVEQPASCIGPSSGVARFARDSASSG